MPVFQFDIKIRCLYHLQLNMKNEEQAKKQNSNIVKSKQNLLYMY